jgi:hypothetical protein
MSLGDAKVVSSGARLACCLAPALFVLFSLASCHVRTDVNQQEAKRRIIAALPSGWKLAKSITLATPFEQLPADRNRTGEELILEGPTALHVQGYYCRDAYCARTAKEVLEIWIMPADYSNGQDIPNILAWRIPERIESGAKVQMFALVSRDYSTPADFDRAFNGSSSESSSLDQAGSQDLPLSWKGWRADILHALDPGGVP